MSQTLKETIKQKVDNYFPEFLGWFKHLHQNPELSFEEQHTAKYIEKKLKEWGVLHRTGIGGNGMLGVLKCNNPEKRTIALRADMDALPINEATDLPYASCNKGVMHACGHDAHMTSLLGTIKILIDLKDELEGTFLFVFQPGEERHPGGASLMLKDGLFDEFKPDLIIGQHVLPDMPTGHVGFKEGIYMASGDEVHLTFHGKGGHAAMPHRFIDPVVMSAQALVSLQNIASRFAPANIPTVLSFGKVIADGATNVIPDKVKISGTFRTLDEAWRNKAKGLIRQISHSTASAFGGTCEDDIKDGYPCVVNNVPATRSAKEIAIEYLDEDHVEDMAIRMTAEDFGFFCEAYPAVFYRFGVKGPEMQSISGLHTSTFQLDTESLRTSIGVMTYLGALLKGE